MNKISTRDITIYAFLVSVLIVQKIAFSFLPNISLTIFLIILFSKKLGLIKTSILVFAFVLLDSFIFGTFNLIYTSVAFIGYFLIPLLINTLFKKVESPLFLSLLSVLFSFLYCWVYILPNIFVYNIDVIEYLISDILFELLMAISSFLSTLFLFKPCSKLFSLYHIN